MSLQILRGAYFTDAGMLALWNPERFTGISDYETWERELYRDVDIVRHIEAGAFVPVNINSDGSFGFEVRIGDGAQAAVLNAREQQYHVIMSDPYFFRGRSACVSGIEHIEGEPGRLVGRLDIPPGDYAVTVSMIDWEREPGSRDEAGRPVENALPDFVILMNPATPESGPFRTKVETFDRPLE